MKSQYIKCPRCELNYILKKDKYCDVCKQEMKAGCLEENDLDDFEEGMELCPICKVNYLSEGETICPTCQEEQLAYDKDEDVDWKSVVENQTEEDDDDLDLLPVEDNDEISEEMDNAFAKDLDEDFADEEKEEEEYYDDLDDDFDDSINDDDIDDDDIDDDEDDDDEDNDDDDDDEDDDDEDEDF